MSGSGAPGYTPSPRPSYDRPTLIKRTEVKTHTWGDRETGLVADWIYASTDKLHCIVFGLAAGAAFRHSPSYRTVFGADEVLHVLTGTMVTVNPETGEVVQVPAGDSLFFGPGNWHHAHAHHGQPLRVLEFFAPPPSQGTSGPYAATRPYVEVPSGGRDELLGSIPGNPGEAGGASGLRVVRHNDLSWRYQDGLLVGIIASTPELTVATIEIDPGVHGVPTAHGGDALFVGIQGSVFVRTQFEGATATVEVGALDAVFLPQGTSYEVLSFGERARAVLGVAPSYLP